MNIVDAHPHFDSADSARDPPIQIDWCTMAYPIQNKSSLEDARQTFYTTIDLTS